MPIVLVCLVIVKQEIPSSSPPQDEEAPAPVDQLNSNSEEASSKPATQSETQAFDIPGLIAFLATIITFLVFLNVAGQKLSWTHPLVISIAVVCAVSATLFFLFETVWSPSPLIPLAQIWESGVGPFCLGQVFLFIALVGV